MTRADYPMLQHWLSQPHIGGWWGSPECEIALFKRDLDTGPTDMRIVWADAPFAYVQDYPAHFWPAPQFAGLAKDARAIDTFLGDPAYLGQGHGSTYLCQRATELTKAGASTIVVDPDPQNTRAIAAYTKAGFTPLEERVCEDGDPVLVMTFTPGPTK
ncbi:GNAT family N-acetyltransferase [Actibacterium sp. 188UL27-1]|uniref:GNAT family N-acetyltransferase n=1 Tax=Actibacterium sp. 188UL27-1 TaxID=2786961 RepID=UPI00195AC81D|nr:GNAT family N-acetyltransferase [Actibacterium sp. 188UL27-1]